MNITDISSLAVEILGRFNLQDLESQVSSLLKESEKISSNKGYQSDEYIQKLKEYNKALKLKEIITALSKNLEELNSTKKLLQNEDMKELAEEEINTLESQILKDIKEAEFLTKKILPNDNKKAILEFRPGVGGIEASLFAEELFRAYSKYCVLKGYKTEIYSIDYNAEGGINEVVMLVDEPEAYSVFRFESGVHRVQRVPSTEASGRIHTSTASLVVMPKVEKADFKINPDDIRIDVYRSSGPGGQSVNTTDSAVRVTHLPTGITVACQNTKSQIKNKEVALSILASKLQQIEDEKNSSNVQNLREESIKGGDRSSKIRTYNFPQGRITDHRINKSWFNIAEVMDGNLDEIINEVSLELRKE